MGNILKDSSKSEQRVLITRSIDVTQSCDNIYREPIIHDNAIREKIMKSLNDPYYSKEIKWKYYDMIDVEFLTIVNYDEAERILGFEKLLKIYNSCPYTLLALTITLVCKIPPYLHYISNFKYYYRNEDGAVSITINDDKFYLIPIRFGLQHLRQFEDVTINRLK